jgi:hypothetical protein
MDVAQQASAIPAPAPVDRVPPSHVSYRVIAGRQATYYVWMPQHETVSLRYGDQEAAIDRGVAPLVLALWRHGIRTSGSCERAPDAHSAWVGFPTLADAKAAATLCPGASLWIGQMRGGGPVPEDDREIFAAAGGSIAAASLLFPTLEAAQAAARALGGGAANPHDGED